MLLVWLITARQQPPRGCCNNELGTACLVVLNNSKNIQFWKYFYFCTEWMRANRRQSLAELCNPKLVRLAQVPHRTADREDPKLARRKWQPPHNMGEPQTETH